MDLIAAVIFGIIQGITEWFPVSSTGHLVLAQELMHVPAAESVLFDLILHAATLLSVTVFLRKELAGIVRSMLSKKGSLDPSGVASRRLGWLALLATIPALMTGLLLSRYLEEVFTPGATAVALLMTGVMLWFAEMPRLRKERSDIGVRDALIIGLFQSAAVIPGISRSGSSIASGCYLGFRRQLVAVFSFILSVPLIIAALAYGSVSLDNTQIEIVPTAIAAIVTFVVGLLALKLLFSMIQKFKLRLFSIYCWAVGIIVLCLVGVQGIA